MCGVDCYGASSCWPGRHERQFIPDAQALDEGLAHMDHTAQRLGGALLDLLPTGDGQPYIPELVGPECVPQIESLPCPGMSMGGIGAGARVLPSTQAPLPLSTTKKQ